MAAPGGDPDDAWAQAERAEAALALLADLWRRERRASAARAAADRGARPLAARVAAGHALDRLAVADEDPFPGDRVLVWLEPARRAGGPAPGAGAGSSQAGDPLERLRVGPGDPVIVWSPGASGAQAPGDPEARGGRRGPRDDDDARPAVARGVLARRRGGRLGVVLPVEQADLLPESGLVLDRDDAQTTFDRGDEALARARAAPGPSDAARLRALLWGGRAPRFRATPPAAPAPPAGAPGAHRGDGPARGGALGVPSSSGPVLAWDGLTPVPEGERRGALDGEASRASAQPDGLPSPKASFFVGEGFTPSPSSRSAGSCGGEPRPYDDEGKPRGSLLGWAPLDEHLNAPQREAVARALAAEDLALVHGPPGTGKTRTLVEVVRQAVLRGERVLATAASHVAVDNLAERLLAHGLDVVRVGHPARVAPALEARALDRLLQESDAWALARQWRREASVLRRGAEKRQARAGELRRDERAAARAEARDAFREARRLEQDARHGLRRAAEAIVGRAPVVCATAAGVEVDALGEQTFDLVVLDEATQAADPVALVALLRGRRWVLAGDPCQLPPVVEDPEAARAGLGETAFERLARGPAGRDALRLLTVQHRMHEAIMTFPSLAHYEGRLEAHPAVAAHRLEDLPGVAPDPLRPAPLVFVDAAGTGWSEERPPEDPSTRNPGLAARTAREVRRLLGRGLAPRDLAVITPYEAQVRLLRDLLEDARAAGLEVGTVDGFQGREKEAVVLDLVRSNDEGAVGFLADARRLNVALTRARRQLLVLGDSATLAGHPHLAAFLEAVRAHGLWLSAFEDDAPAFEG